MQLFIQKGVCIVNFGEYILCVFFNGQMDFSQAEVVVDLIVFFFKFSYVIVMQQMCGGFLDEIKKLWQELIDFVSLIELEFDFFEEDVEFVDCSKLEVLVQQIQCIIKVLFDFF